MATPEVKSPKGQAQLPPDHIFVSTGGGKHTLPGSQDRVDPAESVEETGARRGRPVGVGSSLPLTETG